MTIHIPWLLDVVVAAFEQHLHDARGLRDSTSAEYARHARRFSRAALGADPIDLGRLAPSDVLEYIIRSTEGLHPKTVLSIEAALRSFFRFLRVEGLSDGRLEDALPSVAQRRFASLPRGGILTEEELARLLASAATSKYPARDRAIVTCFAGLGLRPGDVADLRLDDIDWRAGTLRVGAHKTRRERVLPLPREVGRAIVAYLRTERPKTSERRVFVHHREQVRGARSPAAASLGSSPRRCGARTSSSRAGAPTSCGTRWRAAWSGAGRVSRKSPTSWATARSRPPWSTPSSTFPRFARLPCRGRR